MVWKIRDDEIIVETLNLRVCVSKKRRLIEPDFCNFLPFPSNFIPRKVN